MSRSIAYCVLLAAALSPASAHADQPAADEKQPPPAESEPGAGVPKPPAEDTRSGHIYIRAGSDLEIPTGFLRSDVATVDVVGLGVGVDASIGVGLSRHAEIDVSGTYAFMQSGGRCTSCSGDHAAVNLGFTYHLAQGVALDPWIRLGAGYRTANYQNGTGGPPLLVSGRFHGVDFMDLGLGATFFPTPGFGLGPFANADVGTYVGRPVSMTGSSGGERVYAFFQLGLQFALDPMRWAKKPAPAATKTALAAPSY